MMRLLLIEDDQQLNQQLASQLRNKGYAVDVAFDGQEGLYLGLEINYDLAIIDLGLPLLDGIRLISQLRQQQRLFPIIILTARSRWEEKVNGLEAGADDYLVKPFQLEELLARLNALKRRNAGWVAQVMQFSNMSIDTNSKQVAINEHFIELTAYEYNILEYLAIHPGKVVSKSELTEHIYEQDYDRDSNVIEVFIRRLRKKLDPDNSINIITTHRGSGYSFNLSPNASQ